MIKKVFIILAAVFFFSVLQVNIHAFEKVKLYFFWANGCPHCAKEKIFLDTLSDNYPDLTVKDYEVTNSRGNQNLLQKVGKELDADVSGVPFTLIGKTHFTGYYNDEITGVQIEDAVKEAMSGDYYDAVENLIAADKKEQLTPSETAEPKLDVPFLGSLNLKNLSLPLLTLIVALLDGFNPCAMWTLLFLISLLLGMKDRRRMWILGITFIAASAFVYFLFMSAWLNLFLFLGLVTWVRMIIALVAISAGGYYLRDYWVNKAGGCEVMGDKKRQQVFNKIRSITRKQNFFLAISGMVFLAFAVNLVELICSAGLPAIYTNILSLAELPGWQYYLYLVFYIIIFMLDDLIVFFTAMITLQAVGIQSKYSRLSHLIGGILMLVIGVLLIFKPQWLMFG